VPKLTFRPSPAFPAEYLERNKVDNQRLGLPVFGEAKGTLGALAVVGGGPEVARYVDELRAWDGEIWAINGAFDWCKERGIHATFFTLDASIELATIAAGATKAVLADWCPTDVVGAVNGPVQLVRVEGTPLGCSSAASAPMLAAIAGYPSLTMFGVESSFRGEQEHVYQWQLAVPSRALVECGGREYLTSPSLIMQAEYLADIARKVGGYVMVKGDGFLPALIEHGDYEVLKVSRDLVRSIDIARNAAGGVS
jgi:hypothetical protein